MIKKIYLAGPEVFLKNAIEIGELKKELCSKYGFEGLFPLDNTIKTCNMSKEEIAYTIRKENIKLIKESDMCIANITPFRGSSIDSGTAFEVGYFSALDKPLFLYSNDSREYKSRVSIKSDFDDNGMEIENFGLSENLMIPDSSFLDIVLSDVPSNEYYTSMKNFELLLKSIKKYF